MDNGPINELHVNALGKLFFAACAAWIAGHATSVKLRGTLDEVNAVTAAIVSSRKFQDEMNRPGATVASVLEKLNLKHASAVEFERRLGVPWPL